MHPMQGAMSMEMDTRISFWELEEPEECAIAEGASTCDPLNVVARRTFHMDGYGFIHDFAVTKNYYVILQA